MLSNISSMRNYNYICSVSYQKVKSFSSLIHSSTVKKISLIALAIVATVSFAYFVYCRVSHRFANLKKEGNLLAKLKEIPKPVPASKEVAEDKNCLEHVPEKGVDVLKVQSPALIELEEKSEFKNEVEDDLEIESEKPQELEKLEKLEKIVPVDVDIVEPPKEDPPLSLDQVKEMLSKRGDLQRIEGKFYLRHEKIEGKGKLEFLEPLFCVIEGRIQAGQLVEGKVTYKGPVYDDEGHYQWEEHEGDFRKARLTKGTITLSNGTIYRGTFVEENAGLVLDRQGEITYPWGATYQGDFVKGELRAGIVTLPGGIIYEGEFEGNILKKGTITLPGGYTKIGGYNQRGLFEGTLIYTDLQGRQWQREIKEGLISADRTQMNPPADQPHDQDIPDDRRVDNSDPKNIKEMIGEFTIDDTGALAGQGIAICKREDSWWMEEGIFEGSKLVNGKTTYYREIDEEDGEENPSFEFDGTYSDNLQGRYVQWSYHQEKIAIEIHEGNFPSTPSEECEFYTILEGMGRIQSVEGNKQEGLFKDGELIQGRKIFTERVHTNERTRRKEKIPGRKEEGYFYKDKFNSGQIVYASGLSRRGEKTSGWVEHSQVNPMAAYHQVGGIRSDQRDFSVEELFNGIQIRPDKKIVHKVREEIVIESSIKRYECTFIDF